MAENLNKENFWNEIMKLYPKTYTHFCNWIDGYKKEVDWNKLFTGNYGFSKGGTCCTTKFHNIPIEMQIGVLIKYFLEEHNKGVLIKYYDKINFETLSNHYKNEFEIIEQRLA